MGIETKLEGESGLSYKVMDAFVKYVPRGLRETLGGEGGGYTSLGIMASGIVLGPGIFFGGLALYSGFLGCRELNRYVGKTDAE